MAQTTYNFATAKGVAGGIYDMHHYKVDSRYNEEENGVLRCGVGVVCGTNAGSSVKLPNGSVSPKLFEGVVVNGFTYQHDLEGKVFIPHNANVGVMREGKIWVRLAEGAEPKYGDPVFIVESGDEAGCFATSGGTALLGRFIGEANRGLAPVELYGVDL